MSDAPQYDSEENAYVRKLLKELPKIKASADFEMRLQRRMNEGKKFSESDGALEKIIRTFRIPAFAYSLLTILLVGVISYYTFFRQGSSPVIPTNEPPVLKDAGSQQSLSGKVEPPTISTSPEKKEQIEKHLETREESHQSSVQPLQKIEQQQLQKSGPSQYRTVPQKLNQEEVKEKRNILNEAPMQDVVAKPQENTEPSFNAATEGQRINQSIMKDEESVGSALRQVTRPMAPILRPFGPLTKSAFESNVLSAKDSAAIRDSIEADSLKKLHIIKMKQRKKSGKPDQ